MSVQFCDGAISLRDSASIKVLHLLWYNGPEWVKRLSDADRRRISDADAYDARGRTVPWLEGQISGRILQFQAFGDWPKLLDGSHMPERFKCPVESE